MRAAVAGGQVIIRTACIVRLAWVLIALLGAPAGAGAREWRPWCGPVSSAEQALESDPSLGWHFYCDRDEQAGEAPIVTPPQSSALPPGASMERILGLRRNLEESRATAILAPNEENVAAYLYLQQQELQRAATFSDAFRRTVWANPELDYTLKRPAGALAKQLWSNERRSEREAALARLGERYGLIYLGHSDCSGCKVFGPLLRAFALRHGLDVLAVSLSGEALEGWPEAVADNGRSARLGLQGTPVPAVVLFDTQTKQVLPVAFGVVAEDQLAERIFALTARETGNDY